MNIKQLSIFVENRSGRLAEITSLLAEKNINIRAFSIADTKDFGILRLIVDCPDEAEAALKEAGYMVSITHVIAVHMEDRPGALARIMKVILTTGMSVEYMYAFVTEVKGEAYTVLRVSENETVIKALQEAGIKLAESGDIFRN